MIVYYSGTGNSRYVAEAIAHHTDDKMVDATSYIRQGEHPKLTSSRPWVFVAPIYAWRLPHIFKEWIEHSRFIGNPKAYFVLTCGSDIGNAARYLKKLCKQVNFEFSLEVF